MDPYLQGVEYTAPSLVLGKRVQASMVIGALTSIGQEIVLAYGENPAKLVWSDKYLPWLQHMYDGWRKEEPATTKQLSIEANVPELVADHGLWVSATERDRAVGDLTLITFYYLLHIGEYTIKGTHTEMKQTMQFKWEDITFFKNNQLGQL